MKKVVSLSAVAVFAFAMTLAGCDKKDEAPAPPPSPPAAPGGALKPSEVPPPPATAPQKDESKTK
jgi:hypothetical protein